MISLNTLALTSALQSRHLTLVFLFVLLFFVVVVIQGIIEVPYRIFRLHFDTSTFMTLLSDN